MVPPGTPKCVSEPTTWKTASERFAPAMLPARVPPGHSTPGPSAQSPQRPPTKPQPQPQPLQIRQQQEHTRFLATHVAHATEAQELAQAAAMKAELQASVAQQRSDAIAGAANLEVQAARKASTKAVDLAEEQLRRKAEIHCAQVHAAAAAQIDAVKLEAEELHTSCIAKQSEEHASSIGNKDKELSETRRELEEVYAQLHTVWIEKERGKLQAHDVERLNSPVVVVAKQGSVNEGLTL